MPKRAEPVLAMPKRADTDLEFAIREGTLNNEHALKQLFSRQANFLNDPGLLPCMHERGQAIFANAIEKDVPHAISTHGNPVVHILQRVLTEIGAVFVENAVLIKKEGIDVAEAWEKHFKHQEKKTIPPAPVSGDTTESRDLSGADSEMSRVDTLRKRKMLTQGAPEKPAKVPKRKGTEEFEVPTQFPDGKADMHDYNTDSSQTSKASHDSTKKSHIVKLCVPKRYQSANDMPPRKGRLAGSSKANKTRKSAELTISSNPNEELRDGDSEDTPRRDTPADESSPKATPAKQTITNTTPSKNPPAKDAPRRRSTRVLDKQAPKPTPTTSTSAANTTQAPTPPSTSKPPPNQPLLASTSTPPRPHTPLPFPPFPPLAPRDLPSFHNGALIALDNIREGHAKDDTLTLPQLVQELEDNAPTPAKGERKSVFVTVLLGGEWVYESLRSVWGERGEREDEGADGEMEEEEGGVEGEKEGKEDGKGKGKEEEKKKEKETEGESEFIERALSELTAYVEAEHSRMERRA